MDQNIVRESYRVDLTPAAIVNRPARLRWNKERFKGGLGALLAGSFAMAVILLPFVLWWLPWLHR